MKKLVVLLAVVVLLFRCASDDEGFPVEKNNDPFALKAIDKSTDLSIFASVSYTVNSDKKTI